jgi:excisionase family DNA binding protein
MLSLPELTQAAPTPRLLLTPRQAAEALGFSERKLWSLTSPRGPIPCVRIGKSVRYSVAALEAWVEQQQATV